MFHSEKKIKVVGYVLFILGMIGGVFGIDFIGNNLMFGIMTFANSIVFIMIGIVLVKYNKRFVIEEDIV